MKHTKISFGVATAALMTTLVLAPTTAAQAQSSTAGDVLDQQGRVVDISPSQLVLATTKGMQRFAITPDTQQPLNFQNGDYIDVRYRMAGGPGSIGTIAGVEDMPGATTTTVASAAPGSSSQPAFSGEAVSLSPGTAPLVATNSMSETTSPATTTSKGDTERQQLPQTASIMPLIGLIGLFSLAGALALRVIARA